MRLQVSVLFNEPKLLKFLLGDEFVSGEFIGFSALQRAEIAEIGVETSFYRASDGVSVLFNEPKLLKSKSNASTKTTRKVSVLFNEPKLLKWLTRTPIPLST